MYCVNNLIFPRYYAYKRSVNLFFLNCSEFADIFDVEWFISSLSRDVTVVKRIPDKVMRSMDKPPYTMRVPRKSTPEYYLDVALPILLRRRVSRNSLSTYEAF